MSCRLRHGSQLRPRTSCRNREAASTRGGDSGLSVAGTTNASSRQVSMDGRRAEHSALPSVRIIPAAAVVASAADSILRPMNAGFLGFDSSLMLDVVVCALVLVVPVVIYSLYLVKVRRNYAQHAFVQTALSVVLLLVVAAFEIDMRMHGGWEKIINKDPAAPRLAARPSSRFARCSGFIWYSRSPLRSCG